jgi:chemotaxis protein CheC
MKMIATVPNMTVDMVGALLSVPATEFGKYGDKLLMIQSEFGEKDFVTGYFLLIPELESYDKILSSLGM